jgi:hypothetical protein
MLEKQSIFIKIFDIDEKPLPSPINPINNIYWCCSGISG